MSKNRTFIAVTAKRPMAHFRRFEIFFLNPKSISTIANSVHKTEIAANRARGTYSKKKQDVSIFVTIKRWMTKSVQNRAGVRPGLDFKTDLSVLF